MTAKKGLGFLLLAYGGWTTFQDFNNQGAGIMDLLFVGSGLFLVLS